MTPNLFKAWRKALGLSQKKAADALGLKNRIVQYYEKGERDGEKAPKTHQTRTIDLTTTVVERLIKWRQTQRVESLRRGRKVPIYVLTNRRGSPRRQDGNMRRAFGRAMAGCNLTGHTPHDLRDTFASTHLSQDWGKLGWVSRQLGHESAMTTERHYFKFEPTTTSVRYADQIRASAAEG